jgi:precorrin-2 dehydrogenase/sirohydrochlorin ferrochelatase
VSAYPLMLDGDSLSALVVGGGSIAERKVAALLDAGATVRVVATSVSAGVRAMEIPARGRLVITERAYQSEDIADALLVVAVTNDATVNERVVSDCRARRRLVNAASAPENGNCVTPAVHRAGALLIAVSAGGLPSAAARIRDALASRFDARYARAVETLGGLRTRLLDRGERARWRTIADELIDEDFCERVERGEIDEIERVTAWH